MCKIPEEYMWKITKEGCNLDEYSGYRDPSPFGRSLREKRVTEIICPKCGKAHLELRMEDLKTPKGLEFEVYRVRCTECDWKCPIVSVDNGDAIGEFRTWLEAFTLMGSPIDKVDENVIPYLYPEGEIRDRVIKDYAEELDFDDLFEFEDSEDDE